jgi:hypothetical protein
MNEVWPNSYRSEVNLRLKELHSLVWLGQQEKEKRRMVIAMLETLVGSSSAPTPGTQAALNGTRTG